jgi:T5SS/PEP-CTERM-associated repeat protein
MAIVWLMAAAPGVAAILEEGNVTLSPTGVNEVGSFGRGTGDGSVWITPPSTLTGNSLRIATGISSSNVFAGNVYVQGGAINIMQDIVLSEGGRGLLEVTDGGLVDANLLTLAGPTFTSPTIAQATMMLDGAGTQARIKQKVTIGETGFAEVFITGGAQFQSGTQIPNQQAIIANRMSSVASVLLDGQSSAWQHSGPIIVGAMGTGSLHAKGGANISSTGAILGSASEGPQMSLGSTVLEGEGTRWITAGLTLGDRGVGEMRVTDGALLEVTNAQQQLGTVLGNQPGSFGRLIISGPGTRWVDSRSATIGKAGTGELWIEGGAVVANAGATIGQSFSTGSGLAVVRGSQTRWHAGGVAVGIEGSGQLRIEDGATVAVAGLSTQVGLSRIGSTGRVTLDDGTLTIGLTQPFENRGIVEGDGLLIVQTLNNVQNGQIRVGEEDLLRISGALNTTQTGRVEILGGELEVGKIFTNGPQGRVIFEGGTLRAPLNKGFVNNGIATFLANGNRVIGEVANDNSGSITAAANSELTFHNNVINFGAIKASAGATITVLGALSGNGVVGPGTVFLEGPVTPGFSPGAMNFGGDVTLGDLSELTIEIAGATARLEHDQLNVLGALELSGDLNLHALSRLNQESTLTIAAASELGGAFATTPELGADIGFGVRFNGVNYDYENDAVTVSLLPSPPLSGDFDLDGAVDGADFLAWQRQLGSTVDPVGAGADGNADGTVDGADLSLWQQGFAGDGTAPPTVQTAVPEPSVGALVLVGLLGLGGRRVIGRRPLRL